MWDYIIPEECGDFDCSEFNAEDSKLLRDAFREATSARIFSAEYLEFTHSPSTQVVH